MKKIESYAPPVGGIPKTDLATAVQGSLTAADSSTSRSVNALFSWSSIAEEYYQRLANERREMWELRAWRAGEKISKGSGRLPGSWFLYNDSTGNIKVARCVVAGVTGDTEPTWPTTDYHTSPGTSEVVDGTVTWRTFNIYCFSSTISGAAANNTGNGSQTNPFSDPRMLNASYVDGNGVTRTQEVLYSGRAIALKRGTTFDQYSSGSGLQRFYVQRATTEVTANTTAGVTTNPLYFWSMLAYGNGADPVVEIDQTMQFGVRVAYSSQNQNHGFRTFQDFVIQATSGVGNLVSSPSVATRECGGFYSSADPATPSWYSTLDVSIKMINVRVVGLAPSQASKDIATANSLDYATYAADVNGIKSTGKNCEFIGCTAINVWDDAFWLIGSNMWLTFCRSIDAGYAVAQYPTRTRGDCFQVNSTLAAGNGNTPCQGLFVLFNEGLKRTAKKHVFICNPDVYDPAGAVTTVGGLNYKYGKYSSGFVIAYNRFWSETADLTTGVPAAYLCGFTGAVFSNIFVNKYAGPALATGVHLFASADFYNNVVYTSSGGQVRGVEAGSLTADYTSSGQGLFYADSKNSLLRNNTLLINGGLSSIGSTGILNVGALNVVQMYNNLVVGPVGTNTHSGLTPQYGSLIGCNATQNCGGGTYTIGNGVVPVNVGGSLDSGTTDLKLDGWIPKLGSPLALAGYAKGLLPTYDWRGGRRPALPTIGAVECELTL